MSNVQRCRPSKSKPALKKRPLISQNQSAELAALFKILANDTRLRLLHLLAKSDEISVNQLAETLEMKPQAISNQLQRLVDRGIINCKRNGNHVFYKVIDPCIIALLDLGLCLNEESNRVNS